MAEDFENTPVGSSDDPFDQPYTDNTPYVGYDDPIDSDASEETSAARAEEPRPHYYPVSKRKLILMSLLTFGVYEIYWFYKNWEYVRDRDKVKIRPFGRALFAPLFLHPLIVDINQSRDGGGITKNHAIGLFIAYIVISALWRLPAPWWLISCLSFLPLLPVMSQIEFLNRECPQELYKNSEWRPRNWVLTGLVGPLTLFVIISTLNVIPTTQVVSGDQMWDRDVAFLEEVGLLEDDEEILYFSSQDVFDMRNDGNLLTESKVVSYWKDADTQELLAEVARYEEIADFETQRAESFTEDTIITVHRHDGSSFILVVSNAENRDQLFIDALETRVW